jgi:hypothetical protein
MQSSHDGFYCVYQTHPHKRMESYAGRAERAIALLYFSIKRAFCVVYLFFVGLLATADSGLRPTQHIGLMSAYSHSTSEA